MKKILLGMFLGLFCSLAIARAGDLPQPLVEARLNDSDLQTQTENTGAAGGFFNLTSSVHTGAGMGVSGLPDDYALDNSSIEMGEEGGRAEMEYCLNVCESPFTLCGWFKTNGEENPIRNSARLFSAGNFEIYGVDSDLRLSLCGSRFTTCGDVFDKSGVYIFFAVVNDGQTVFFYKGDCDQVVFLVYEKSITGEDENRSKSKRRPKSFSHEEECKVVIGNRANGEKAFDGILDNIRFFKKSLLLCQLEQIRLADIGNSPIANVTPEETPTPEPTPQPTPTPETGGGGGGEEQKDRLYVTRTEPTDGAENVPSDTLVIAYMNQFIQTDDVNTEDGGREDEKFFVLNIMDGSEIGERIPGITVADNVDGRGMLTFTPGNILQTGEYRAKVTESLRAANYGGTNAESFTWNFGVVAVEITPTPEETPTSTPEPEITPMPGPGIDF